MVHKVYSALYTKLVMYLQQLLFTTGTCLVEAGSCKLHSEQQDIHELFQSRPIYHIRDKEDHPIVLRRGEGMKLGVEGRGREWRVKGMKWGGGGGGGEKVVRGRRKGEGD